MKYDTVIFDLDGTLLNTLDDLYLSVNYALSIYHYPLRSKEEIRQFLGNGVRVLINKSLPIDKSKLEEVLTTFKSYYQTHHSLHAHKYNGIDELLIELTKRKIKLAVVTNKFDLAAQELVNSFFGNQFNVIIGEQAHLKRKPDPDMCLEALRQLNSQPERTIYIGDSEVDIQTAQNIGVFNVICSWGFRTKEELLKTGSVNIIDEPTELLKFL